MADEVALRCLNGPCRFSRIGSGPFALPGNGAASASLGCEDKLAKLFFSKAGGVSGVNYGALTEP
jgi:hypothetical protein